MSKALTFDFLSELLGSIFCVAEVLAKGHFTSMKSKFLIISCVMTCVQMTFELGIMRDHNKK